MIYLGAVLGIAMVALALQHVAYIIQYGSIFEWHRIWLLQRSRRYWFAAKLYELMMCQMCSITQLALWWVTLPLAWIGREHLVQYPAAGLVVLSWLWFAIAALGLAAWDIARLVGRGSDALILLARKGAKQ